MTDQAITDAINRHLGRKIALVMEARGKSRASLAADLGMTETRLARIIKGSSGMTAAELVLASRALCVPLQTIAF